MCDAGRFYLKRFDTLLLIKIEVSTIAKSLNFIKVKMYVIKCMLSNIRLIYGTKNGCNLYRFKYIFKLLTSVVDFLKKQLSTYSLTKSFASCDF